MNVRRSATAKPNLMSPALTTSAQQAIDALDRAIGEPAAELKQDVDVAERAIAGLRDCLIRELRQAQPASDASRLRAILEQTNAALSLVAGVEYPSGGLQRTLLEQARDVLQQVLSGAR